MIKTLCFCSIFSCMKEHTHMCRVVQKFSEDWDSGPLLYAFTMHTSECLYIPYMSKVMVIPHSWSHKCNAQKQTPYLFGFQMCSADGFKQATCDLGHPAKKTIPSERSVCVGGGVHRPPHSSSPHELCTNRTGQLAVSLRVISVSCQVLALS